jgi:hypothetical protein
MEIMNGIFKNAEFNIGIVISALIIICYTIFILPGIDLTIPTHGDIYGYYFIYDSIPFSAIYITPRPIMGLALKLGGLVPFNVMMWTFSIVGIISFISPLIAYSKIVKKDIPISGLILFAFLVVSYPALYIGLVHDIGSRLALIFAVIAVYYYVKFFQQNDYYYLFVAFIFVLLGFFSKETFGPFLFLLTGYIGYLYRAKIGHIVAGMFTVILGLIISMLHSRFLDSPFTSGNSSYTVDFNVLHVLKSGIRYLSLAVSPQIIFCLLVIGLFLVWKRNWKWLILFLLSLLISWSSLLPNAMLTQHGGSNYEMIVIPILSALIVMQMDYLGLFCKYKRIIICSMVALVVSGVFWGEHKIKHYWWEMGVAHFNQNATHSLDIYKEEIRVSNNIIILGLQADHLVPPAIPFLSSKYLKNDFGFLTNTFLIISPGLANIFASINDNVRIYIPGLEKINKSSVDLIMVFGADGNIWKIIRQKEQIIKFLELKDLDVTKLYNKQYWATSIDPKLMQ